MPEASPHPLHVHLCGSVPLDTAEEVFRTVSEAAGSHLARLPDGETGNRILWIGYLGNILVSHPDMEPDPENPSFDWYQWDGTLVWTLPQLRFKPGVDPDKVRFPLTYADEALESWAVFQKLQAEGVIPAAVKFQVSLPTPLAPTYQFISPSAHETFLRVYERQLLEEVSRIIEAIPHERLSMQWDVCQEVLVWENSYPYRPENYKDQILSQLARIGDAIPDDIDLGYHLCYGSPKDEHLVQPRDSQIMVEMASGLLARIKRPIQYLHLPVPKDRTDAAFFIPMRQLKLPETTDLYLGLIHYDDEDGDRARFKAARRYVRVDGISCECGWGRTDPDRIPGYLKSHVDLIESVEAAAS